MSSFVSNPTVTQQMPNQPGGSTPNNSVRYSPTPSTNPVTRYSPTAVTPNPASTQTVGTAQFTSAPVGGQTQIGNPAGISPQAQAMMGGLAQPYTGNYFTGGNAQPQSANSAQQPVQYNNATNTTTAAIYNSNTGQWGNIDATGNFVPMGGQAANAPPPGFTSWQDFAARSPASQTPAAVQQQINAQGVSSYQPAAMTPLPLSAFGFTGGTTPEQVTQSLASNILAGGQQSQQAQQGNGMQQFLNLYRALSTGQSPTGQSFTMDPTLAFSSIMALLSGAYGGGSQSNLPLYNRSLYSQVP